MTQLPKHEGYYDLAVKGVAISPTDPDVVVTGSASGARIWNRTGDRILELPGTRGSPLSMVCFSKNGDWLAVRRMAGAIAVFDTKSWAEVALVRTPQPGNTVAFSPRDTTLLLAGGNDGVIRGWRITPHLPADAVLEHPQEVFCLEFSSDGAVLAVGLSDGSVRFWNLRSKSEMFTTPPKRKVFSALTLENMMDFVAFSPDSNFAAVIGPETTVSVWDLRHGSAIQSDPLPPSDRYHSIAFSTDGLRLYAGARDAVHVFEWAPGSSVLTKQTEHPISGNRHLGVSQDGRFLVTQSELTTLLDLSEPRGPIRTIPSSEYVSNLAFSPDGSRLAGGGEGGKGVFLWDVASGQMMARLPDLPPIRCISWINDGSRLAASGLYGETRLWDVRSRRVIATFPGTACAFSPDGTMLAVGSDSKFAAQREALGRVRLLKAPPLEEIAGRAVPRPAL